MTDEDDNLKYAKLLYRAGAFISHMDDDGGSDAAILERDALRKTLRGFLIEKDYATVVSVIEETLSHQAAWKSWSANLADFPSELRKNLDGMPLPLRQCIYEIGYCVAVRYRERNFVSAAINGMANSLKNFAAPKRRFKGSVNISPAEKHALNEMAEVLDLRQRMID